MESLIPVVNQLQDVMHTVGGKPLNLPQLVVVGSQSSGKTSVLESVVGRDFLPRGNDIVTRRPLILQLVHDADPETYEGLSESQTQQTESSQKIFSPQPPSMGSSESKKASGPPRRRPPPPPSAPSTSRVAEMRRLLSSKLGSPHPQTPQHSPMVQRDDDELSSISTITSVGCLEDLKAEDAEQPAVWGVAEFGHLPGVKLVDFNRVKQEIIKDTSRVCKNGKAISHVPIRLKITSPNVPTLTLVDLPGLTKLPVGDQPDDIEQQLRDLTLEYVRNSRAVIVAVTPATTDVANSEALKLAREVDPTGDRTIGVLTKLDLMDEGTDAVPTLLGRVIPLTHGFVGVVNRSQKNIHQAVDITQARAQEQAFFEGHPSYASLAHCMGTQYLSAKLSQLLLHRIRLSLPSLKTDVSESLEETRRVCESFGPDPLGADSNNGMADTHKMSFQLLQILSRFSTVFVNILEGKQPSHNVDQTGSEHTSDTSSLTHRSGLYQRWMRKIPDYVLEDTGLMDQRYRLYISESKSKSKRGASKASSKNVRNNNNNKSNSGTANHALDRNSHELYGGARISHIFHQEFSDFIQQLNPLDNLDDLQIRTTLRNAAGARPALFLPERAFEMLIRGLIQKLTPASVDCVDMVAREMSRVVVETIRACPDLWRFPVLAKRVIAVVTDMLKTRVPITKLLIRSLIDMELAYINTRHPDFSGTNGAVRGLMQDAEQKMADKKKRHAHKKHKKQAAPDPMSGWAVPPANDGTKSPWQQQQSSTVHVGRVEEERLHLRGVFDENAPPYPSFPQSPKPVVVTSPVSEMGSPNTSVMSVHTSRCITVEEAKSPMTSPCRSKRPCKSTALTTVPSKESASSDQQSLQRLSSTLGLPLREFCEDRLVLPPVPSTDREVMECQIVKRLLDNYFQLVRKRIHDSVPKAIMLHMVNYAKVHLHNTLIHDLYSTALKAEVQQADGSETVCSGGHSSGRRGSIASVDSVRRYGSVIEDSDELVEEQCGLSALFAESSAQRKERKAQFQRLQCLKEAWKILDKLDHVCVL